MGRWYYEEDDGSGAIIGIIIVVAIVGVLIFVAFWAAVIFGIGYLIYRIVKYYQKQKELEPKKCPRCRKREALVYFKVEKINQRPVTKTVLDKQSQRMDTIRLTEYTNRMYEKCKFCGEITYTDEICTS